MEKYLHSVTILPDKCHGCTHCLNYCPTEAIRIRDGHAVINPVRCIDCDHFYTRDTQWQAAPVCICRARIWDELHRAPHIIGHDPCLPIRCDHFEKKKKEEGQNSGKI